MNSQQAATAFRAVMAAKGLQQDPTNPDLHNCFSMCMDDYTTAGGDVSGLVNLLNMVEPDSEIRRFFEQALAIEIE